MLQDLAPLRSVAERDVDLLVVEELQVSPEFSTWFASAVGVGGDVVGAWHSVTHSSLGESDIVVLFDAGGLSIAVLVENKIDAAPQPDQAKRYRLRGEAGVADGDWSRFVTCMLAPQSYLDGTDDAGEYDVQLPYEDLRSYFEDERSKRGKWKATVVQEAIEQNRRGYAPVVDEAVTDFWLRYWKTVQLLAPELQMPKPGGKPSGSDWPQLKVAGLTIRHKWARGVAHLELPGMASRVDDIDAILPDEFSAVVTGKSASVECKPRLCRPAMRSPRRRTTSLQASSECCALLLSSTSCTRS